MKKIISKVLSFVLCAAMVFSLAACGDATDKAAVADSLIAGTLASTVVSENENYKMLWDNDKKIIVLESKANGQKWSTTPSDYIDLADDEKQTRQRNLLESPVLVTYKDSLENGTATAKGYSDCLKKNNFSVNQADGTVIIQYFFEEADIIVPVKYELLAEGIRLSVDTNGIVEGENPIYSIDLAPYLCGVPTGKADSYIFYPSGSGALIDTSNAGVASGSYSAEVYGEEAARRIKEKLTNDKNVYLPVFGVKNGENAMFAVVSSGAEQAYIKTVLNETASTYSSVWAGFNLRGHDYSAVKANIQYVETAIYSDDMIRDAVFSVDFYPLAGEDANYSGMARRYQKLLYGNNDNTSISENLYSLKVIGGVMKDKDFLGFPYETLVAVTTYNDVAAMLSELSVSGVTPNVQLYGFGDYGMDVGKVAGNMTLSSKFGSKADLSSLMQYCGTNGIDTFVDFNLSQYKNSGHGYTSLFSAAKTANNQSAYQYYLKKTVQTADTENYDRFRLIRRDLLVKLANQMLKKVGKYDINGVSFASITDTAYSDYTSSDYYQKRNMSTDVQGIMQSYKNSGYSVAANGANAYAAIAADVVFETPLTSSKQEIFSADVPFYQMVFKGKVELTTESLNSGEVFEKKKLQALETGSSMLFTVYNTFDRQLSVSPFKGLYGALYADNKDNILSVCEEYKDYYNAISGVTIKEHAVLADGVNLTTYSNGVKIYVNYNDADYQSADGIVQAMNCLIIK